MIYGGRFILFLSYWELNEDRSDEDRLKAAQKLMSAGLFHPEGVNIIHWDGTPDGWGVVLMEADTIKQVFQNLNLCRTALPGFFNLTKTVPAAPVQEIISLAQETQAKLVSL